MSHIQLELFPIGRDIIPPLDFSEEAIDYSEWDTIVLFFSGGKDSLACLLKLLKAGVDPSKIELWHHLVDGSPDEEVFMDWPCTKAYCRAVADAFGIPIYMSWREGGFKAEMLRENARTNPTSFEQPVVASPIPSLFQERVTSGEYIELVTKGGTQGKSSTRLKFPQVTSNLNQRWCSAYLKIMVADMAIRHQTRFNGKKTLFISGERAEESSSRARYKQFEAHRTATSDRIAYIYRAVLYWTENDVWDLIEEFRINPHPAYRLGWSRLSCRHCIFGNDDQWASGRAVDPSGFAEIAQYEVLFDCTIKRKDDIVIRADRGCPYQMNPADVTAANSREWSEPIILPEGAWTLPAGAFGSGAGPT